MNGGELLRMADAIHRDKGIDKEVIFQGIESALNSVLKKRLNAGPQYFISIDRQTGNFIMPEDFEYDIHELGRIAAQSAKQIITQKIREAEKSAILNSFESRRNDILTGTVMRIERGSIIVNIGKLEAILPKSEQVSGESFKLNSIVKAMVLEAKKKNGKIKIILSRSHINFVKRLFELEVPEITDSIVVIKSIAREPGFRTKIAVESTNQKVDAVGACVGVRGTRIKHISDELFGERIDIIPWSDDIVEFVKYALRPAEIRSITLDEETQKAVVIVSKDQLPLAIGRGGQNVRLASKLTQWDIDVVCPEQPEEEEKATEEQTTEEQTADEPAAEEQAEASAPAEVSPSSGEAPETTVADTDKQVSLEPEDPETASDSQPGGTDNIDIPDDKETHSSGNDMDTNTGGEEINENKTV